MYGLVNRSLEDFIRSEFGEMKWLAIREASDVTVDVFENMESYPDLWTYQLVGAAAEHLDRPATEILRGFGRHWVLVTGKSGYRGLMDLAGRTLPEFLGNLNNLHTRVALAFPDLNPPEFEVFEDNGRSLNLKYQSDRDGLAPFVTGLLEGLGEHFNQTLRIHQIATRNSEGCDIFHITYRRKVAVCEVEAHAG